MAEHKLLNLKEMVQPHNTESISTLVEESMEEWGIPREKVLTTITDNGSNMVASFHPRAEVATTSEEDSEAEPSMMTMSILKGRMTGQSVYETMPLTHSTFM